MDVRKKRYLEGMVTVITAATAVLAIAVGLKSTPSGIFTIHKAGTAVAVAGSEVKTSISGTYAAKEVQGAAVTDTYVDVEANLGLRRGQIPYITVSDADAGEYPKEMERVSLVMDAMGGGAVEAVLDINLEARKKGKFVRLTHGSVHVTAGIPVKKNFGEAVCVICVRPDGEVIVMQDVDSNPDTFTFGVQAEECMSWYLV